nr:CpsB/CapC family capsule biosynthesis tyrosine phosphatase [uncultured Allomuricauda sp.]
MFSFFERKRYLVDYLHGLVDIHNHILPGIDDGAKNVEESIEIIKGFSQFGVTNFICTPHIMNHYYPNTSATVKSSFDLLEKELSANNMNNIRIDYAAEHMIDDGFENNLESRQVLPLRKNSLLIEMSYLQPSFNFEYSIAKITQHNYFSILAHPERYVYYHKKYGIYKDLKSSGILFQLNFLSLSGYYGIEIQKVTRKLLKDGLIDFVASDVHNRRQLSALKEIKIPTKVLNLILPIIENTIKTFY